ncbi:hypothetical protein [Candidatus Laterigemmans baculatus]|uniref:hypothetical protein n=1 Tax=Candidatus Laterigemmans baculatus TaxID=2770505 RepID=UPI0013DB3EB5|nr:hypothetical protein [Candidatus Laterigemmans baculatus]
MSRQDDDLDDFRRSAERPLPPELRALEAVLGGLEPRTDRLDQAQLWYQAGRQSVQPSAPPVNPRWSVAKASTLSASLAVAATVLLMAWLRPPVPAVERVQVVAALPEPRLGNSVAEGPGADRLLTDAAAQADVPEPDAASPAGSESPHVQGGLRNRGRSVTAEPHDTARLALISMLLRHGVSPWESLPPPRPENTATAEEPDSELSENPAPPTHYQQRRELLLENLGRNNSEFRTPILLGT